MDTWELDIQGMITASVRNAERECSTEGAKTRTVHTTGIRWMRMSTENTLQMENNYEKKFEVVP